MVCLVGSSHVCRVGCLASKIVYKEWHPRFATETLYAPIPAAMDLLWLGLFAVVACACSHLANVDVFHSLRSANVSIGYPMAHVGTVVPTCVCVGTHIVTHSVLRSEEIWRHRSNFRLRFSVDLGLAVA